MNVVLIFITPVITEVLANVRGPESGPGDRNEFIEIYNTTPYAIDLRGWFITDFDATDTICAWQDSTIFVKYPNVIINSTLLLSNSYALILDREYTRPDTDQYQQPYDIPDLTLILTTDDTSLGNGLSTTDPLLLYAADSSCSTSFGSPFNNIDTIPFDPGDGISLEIIDRYGIDDESNWYPSLDTSGSTPGRDNSTFSNFDLALSSFILHPPIGTDESEVKVEVKVKNIGLQQVDFWELGIFNDQNKDFSLVEDEKIKDITGNLMLPGCSTKIQTEIGTFSLGEYQLGTRIICDVDVNPDNDTCFTSLSIVPKTGIFTVSPKLFYPNRGRLQIEYNLPSVGGRLKISIYSDRGNKIDDLIDQDVDHTEGTLFWDGNDAKIGYYILLLDYNSSGKTFQEKEVFVVAR